MADIKNILLIEDNEDDYILVEEFLPKDEFAITWSDGAGKARDYLTRDTFDIVLLDHGLPDTNALSFIEEIHERQPLLPVIILTGSDDQALAVSAVKKGATNYLLKDEIFEHLLPALNNALSVNRPVSKKQPEKTVRFLDKADHIYRVLLETMNEGCFVMTTDGVITFVNEAAGRMMDCDETELLGHNVWDVFDIETACKLHGILVETEQTTAQSQASQTHTEQGRVYHADKGNIPVLISTRNIRLDERQYDAILVVLTDISEQEHAKRELAFLYQKEQEQHHQLQALIESSRDGIVSIDANLQLLVVNTQAIDLLGLGGRPTEWVGNSIFDALDKLEDLAPEFIEMAMSEVQRVQQGNQAIGSGEIEVSSKTVYWQNLPIQAADGLSGRLLILRDVTEEKLLEQMRDDLTRTMVHDLRNPLTVISTSLQLMDRFDQIGKETLTARQRRSLDQSFSNVKKMSKLVNRILEVSQLENGQLPMDMAQTDISELIGETIQAQTALATSKQIALVSDISPLVPQLEMDAELIGRVLQNLVDNALKFTPIEGEVRVHAYLANEAQQTGTAPSSSESSHIERDIDLPTTHRTFSTIEEANWRYQPAQNESAPNGNGQKEAEMKIGQIPLDATSMMASTSFLKAANPNSLYISVTDNGPGIPVEIQNHLFEKFVTGRHKSSGNGLGLAFCKLAIEAHGGTIWVESEMGKGSAFIMTFPLPVTVEPTSESPSPAYHAVS